MADEKYLKKIGAKKLSESPSGRRYLAEIKKQKANDYLQPSDPKFRKVYGEPT